ncbi:RNA-directed DNA polymerase [Bremerella sp. T1]|uniref:RNA-directed DNA polymerase n=1 Tax=Bremerella sp. TYQ1 TaxID=3119568 RepID=UPI001CCF0A22|nr:RNA-directed DNA polymerase [Bremerella volcania]UBM35202.1 RNA-directed DNA polymerase [Bremerella volcania]
MKPEIQATRALNAARRAHKPTYAGLRRLIGSDSGENLLNWACSVSDRKLLTRVDWRYYDFPILKEIDKRGIPSFRKYTIGSPITLLSEAKLLALMSKEPSFSFPENVYSYLWPRTERSGYNFRFYQHGYVSRNATIRELLRSNPGHVAWISDIQKFYPTIDWSLLQPKLDKRLSSTSSQPLANAISNFCNSLKGSSGAGVPIGPDIGHVLANIALDEVDGRLSELYGKSYLRYVDDIVIVCPKGEVGQVQDSVRECLLKSGLDMHVGKTDVVGADIWVEECPDMTTKGKQDTFESLVHDLSVYLALRPESQEAMSQLFTEHGFSIPFERLVSQSRYRQFHRYVFGAIKQGRFWSTLGLYLSKERDFVGRAEQLRELLLEELRGLVKAPIPGSGMRRRWFVQKIRYRLNRLLYLIPNSLYQELSQLVPIGEEFGEYEILFRSLSNDDVAPLLSYPGRIVSTFCELYQGKYPTMRSSLEVDRNDGAMAEALASLSLHFGTSTRNFSGFLAFEGGRMLLEICERSVDFSGQIEKLSYLDEMEVLMRGATQEQLSTLSRTRFSDGEALGLEGLLMGGAYGGLS